MKTTVKFFSKSTKNGSAKLSSKKYNLTKISAKEVETNRSNAYPYLFN